MVCRIGGGGHNSCHSCGSFSAAITNFYKLHGLRTEKFYSYPRGQKSDVEFAHLEPLEGAWENLSLLIP